MITAWLRIWGLLCLLSDLIQTQEPAMLFDTPTRKPKFATLFKNKAAFDTALDGLEPLGKKMLEHLAKKPREAMPLAFKEIRDALVPTSESSSITSFNMRQFNDHICNQISTTIVPSAHGKIEDLLITVPADQSRFGQWFVDSRYQRHYIALIEGLGGNRTYTVVCHPDTEQQIRNWFTGVNNVTVNFVFSPRFQYSIWAQDAYIALQDASHTSILSEGVLFPRYDDMSIADDVAAQTSTAVLQSYLYFQGGNVLGGPEKTLIGRDYIWQNTTRANLETETKVIDAFEKLFGTEIVVLGGYDSGHYDWYDKGVLSGYGLQPIFHLDMYVTPTGVTGESGKEIVLLGRPSKAREITGKWSEISAYDDDRFNAFFDETEQQLDQHFEVQHLPLMLTYGDLGGNADQHDFYNLSFNNVVLENYGTVRNVVMTTYSQDAPAFKVDPAIRRDLEDAAEAIWAGLGFNVSRTDGMEDLAHGQGSVHCITKTMRRGPVS